MVFHLGMSGRWRIDPQDADKHDHLILETARNRFALNDPRRFGSVDLMTNGELAVWKPFAALGPEPLGDALDSEHLREATRGRKQAIKLLLLDQRIVAGLGNIYVCEALWQAGINPRKAGGKVTMPQLSAVSSRQSARCSNSRSVTAARRCATSRSPMATSAISLPASMSMAAKATPATAMTAGPCGGSRGGAARGSAPCARNSRSGVDQRVMRGRRQPFHLLAEQRPEAGAALHHRIPASRVCSWPFQSIPPR